MTIYRILNRKKDSPYLHSPGSSEEVACEIARFIMGVSVPENGLMAIKEDSPVASFMLMQEKYFCSIQLSEKLKRFWLTEAYSIFNAYKKFNFAKSQAESILEDALYDLETSFGNLKIFKTLSPSEYIGVISTIDEIDDDFGNEVIELMKKTFEFQYAT